MANMQAIKANGQSIRKQYLEGKTPTPILVDIKEAMQKELKTLKRTKLLGREHLQYSPFQQR